MSEARLSVRSARARDIARGLARRESRSIADEVVWALEAYEIRETGRESADAFFDRLISDDRGPDVDLEAIIRANRTVNEPIDLSR